MICFNIMKLRYVPNLNLMREAILILKLTENGSSEALKRTWIEGVQADSYLAFLGNFLKVKCVLSLWASELSIIDEKGLKLVVIDIEPLIAITAWSEGLWSQINDQLNLYLYCCHYLSKKIDQERQWRCPSSAVLPPFSLHFPSKTKLWELDFTTWAPFPYEMSIFGVGLVKFPFLLFFVHFGGFDGVAKVLKVFWVYFMKPALLA